MPFRVELSPQARAQVADVNLWWAENRPAAPTLVAAEFEIAIQRLSSSPESGRFHAQGKQFHVRKMLMPRRSRLAPPHPPMKSVFTYTIP